MGLQPLSTWSRRSVLTAISGLGLTTVAPPTEAAPAKTDPRTIHGFVRELVPGQAKRGLAHVMVSNGCDVAVTDAGGLWSLPARPGGRVFMIKPAHYSYLSDAGIPSFSAEIGPLPLCRNPVEFVVRHCPEPQQFDVLMCADTQPANLVELGYVRHELLRATASARAKFAIHHGDAVGDDTAMFRAYQNVLTETGLIWHHCPGNHDVDLDAATAGDPFGSWQRVFGPLCYAFNYGSATFILLNNICYNQTAARAGEPRPYHGQITADQLTFVRNVLAKTPKDNLVVVSMHIPLASYGAPRSPADMTINRDALLQVLSSHPNVVSFAGHAHATEHHYLNTSPAPLQPPHHHHVLTAFCGSWWSGPVNSLGIPEGDSCDGSPRGFHVLSVDRNQYATRFCASNGGQTRQMRALTFNFDIQPSQPVASASLSEASLSTVLVNVFDGGPKTRVVLDTGMGEPGIEFERTEIADPYVATRFAAHRSTLKPWVKAVPSSHIWSAAVPVTLTRNLDARIRVIGEYGRDLTAIAYEIVDA